MDKRELGPVFRERLETLFAATGATRAAFAKSIGVDRSALTQLLSGQSTRLPRADTLRRISERYSVSLDWLLGLSQDETLAAEIKPALEIAEADDSNNDTLLERWHKEAAGYKIRYVPAQVPDLLRTPDVIAYEYSGRAAPSPSWQLRNAEFRLDYTRRPETDMEVCMPRQRLELLAEGKGLWRGLDRQARQAQLDYMAKLVEELYPSFRLFLYDQRRTYLHPLHRVRSAARGDLRRRDVHGAERDRAYPLADAPFRQSHPPRRGELQRERRLHRFAQSVVGGQKPQFALRNSKDVSPAAMSKPSCA